MDRLSLVKQVISQKENGVFVEIGTHEGQFAEFILENSINTTLYCIDPYINYSDYEDAINNITGDQLYISVYNKLKNKFGNRIIFIRKFSSDAVDFIPDKIDFLYIDDNHQYKYVKEDLLNYYNKVKSDGYIIGDDAVDTEDRNRNSNGDVFIEWSPGCFGNYGVIKAFREFFSDKTDDNLVIGNQYFVKRK